MLYQMSSKQWNRINNERSFKDYSCELCHAQLDDIDH